MRLGVRVWRPALYPIRLKYQTPGLKWHWQQGSLVSQGVGQDAVMYEVGVYLNVSFTRYRHTGHMAEYTKLHLLLIIHTWHRHRMISTEAQVLCMGQAQRSRWANQVCVAVKRERGEPGRRSGIKAPVTTDHTNGCLEAAIRPANCLCVGMGTSDSRL